MDAKNQNNFEDRKKDWIAASGAFTSSDQCSLGRNSDPLKFWTEPSDAESLIPSKFWSPEVVQPFFGKVDEMVQAAFPDEVPRFSRLLKEGAFFFLPAVLQHCTSLGKGADGSVFEGLIDGDNVCIKKHSLPHPSDEIDQSLFESVAQALLGTLSRHCALLENLSSFERVIAYGFPHTIGPRGHFYILFWPGPTPEQRRMCYSCVTEVIQNTEDGKGKLQAASQVERLSFVTKMATLIAFLKFHKIEHKDLHTNNWLVRDVDGDLYPCLIDFGRSDFGALRGAAGPESGAWLGTPDLEKLEELTKKLLGDETEWKKNLNRILQSLS